MLTLNNILYIGFFLFIIVVIVYVTYLFINKYYIKIPPNKAAIIFGRRIQIKDPVTGETRQRGFRIVKGGSALLIPLLEAIEYLDLSNRKIDLEVKNIRSINGIQVDVEAVAIVRIGTDELSLETAATQFGDMNKDETNASIREILNKTLEGHFRTIISTMTPEELYQDRSKFSQEVQRSAGNPLEAMGMKVVDFTIKKVGDNVRYLDSLGVGPAEEEKKKAEIAKSEARRQVEEQKSQDSVKIREADERRNVQEEQSRGREEIEQIQVIERSKIAKIESEIARVKSEIEYMQKKIELQEKKDDLELIKVKLEQKKKVFEAAGNEQASRRKAREIENVAKAKAEEIRMLAKAEADGKRMIAEAYRELDPTSQMLIIIEKLPMVLESLLGKEGLAAVFGEIAKPIGAIDSVRIYDFGGGGNGNGSGNPINKFANTAPQVLTGLVAKLNDMGFGNFLNKIGLNSDMLDQLETSVENKETPPKTNENESKNGTHHKTTTAPPKVDDKVTVKNINKNENSDKKVVEEVPEYEEIKVGDTFEFDLTTSDKK